MQRTIKVQIPENTKIENCEIDNGFLIVTCKSDNVLHLAISDKGSLLMKVGNSVIGVITRYGECHILNDKKKSDAYEKWLEGDMDIDPSEIEFLGEKYSISNNFVLAKNRDINCSIFDFELALFCQDCQDSNIRRYKNGTPKMF